MGQKETQKGPKELESNNVVSRRASGEILGIVLVDSRGRISLLSKVRSCLKIEEGDRLAVFLKDGIIRLTPSQKICAAVEAR